MAPKWSRHMVIRLAECAIDFEAEEKIITAAILARSGIAGESNVTALASLHQALMKLHHPEIEIETADGAEKMKKRLEETPDRITVNIGARGRRR